MSRSSVGLEIRREALGACLLVALWMLPLEGFGAVPAGSCDLAGSVLDLQGQGIPAVAAIPLGPGEGGGLILGTDGGPALVLGVGTRTSDGALVTQSRLLEGDPGVRDLWMTLQDRAVDILDVTALRSCPDLALEDPVEQSLGHGLDRLVRELRPVAPANREATASLIPTSLLQQVVNLLALALVLTYLVLCLFRALGGLRRSPVMNVMVATGLFLLALVVRGAITPRLPVGTANSDLSHLLDVFIWDLWGFGVHQGVTYPPAWRLLLWLAFQPAGPSWDLAAWMTTVAGALLVLPVMAFVSRATGSRTASALAGLAAAVMPVGVRFSNGVLLETPAALVLTLALWHFQSWLDGETGEERRNSGHSSGHSPGEVPPLPLRRTRGASGARLDAWLWSLSLVVLVQTRLETQGVLPLLLLFQGTLATWRGGAKVLAGLWPQVLAGLALVAPFLVQVALLLFTAEASQEGKAAGMALPVFVFGLIGLGIGWDFRRSPWPPGSPWASLFRVLGVFLGLLFLLEAAWQWPGNPLCPSAITHPEFPFFRFYVTWPHGTWPDDRVYPGWLVNAGAFPLPFLALWLLSLWPLRQAPREVVGLAWWMALLPWFGHFLTRHVGTGIAPFEGLRHHVLFLGPVASSLGIGAWHLARWMTRAGLPRWGATVLLAAILASPLGTHRGTMWDQGFDAQDEFRFAREVVSWLPDHSRVLLADDLVDFGPEAMMPPTSILPVFRGNHLWLALGRLSGKVLDVRGVRELLRNPGGVQGFTWFYQGLDCHRSPRPGRMLPTCEAAREAAGGRATFLLRIPNRPYSGHEARRVGIRVPEVELALRPLDADAWEHLRREVLPRIDEVVSGP